MASTLLPFLYQTRTIQRLSRAPLRRQFSQTACRASRHRDPGYPSHDAIPFEGPLGSLSEDAKDPDRSTMTPSEAEVFKSIFDDISQGNMPRPSKFRKMLQQENQSSDADASTSGSLVEQARRARLSDFRDKTLQRFPSSLRQAAETALNLYEFEPSESPSGGNLLELAEKNMKLLKEREECDRKREAEMARLSELMNKCQSDIELWKLLEEHVFVLPAKLGIAESDMTTKTAKKSNKKKSVKSKRSAETEAVTGTEATSPEPKHSMDIYGPLYSQILLRALDQFDKAFPHPSPYAFNILPRVRSIGLSSYVLGVSTTFYTRLARIHWERFGDATSALEMIEEMNSIGLQPDVKAHDLLLRIRDELHACASGSQGPFVAAMMESPPYDAAMVQRLEEMEEYVRGLLMDARGEFAA